MKLLHVIHDNRISGVAMRALTVAPQLRAQGIEPIFVVPDEAGSVDEKCRELGLPVHRAYMPRPTLKARHLLRVLVWLVGLPRTALQLRRLIHRERADCLHVNGLVNVGPWLAAWLTRKPIVWHLCGTDYPKALVRILIPLIRRRSEIIYISPQVGNYFLGTGGRNSNEHLLFEPVDLAVLERRMRQSAPESLREIIGDNDNAPVCLTVGNLSPRKGAHYLIEAIALMKDAGLRMKLAVVGESLSVHLDYERQLHQRIQELGLTEQVFFLGRRDDVPALMQQADVFALASNSEGTPLVIMEAMALYLPVVATAVGGVPDMITDNENGLLVDKGSPTQLQAALSRLVQESGLRERLTQKARRTTEEKFSLSTHVKGFAAIIKRAATET